MIAKIKKYFTVKLKSSKLMIALSLATLAILILATITIMTIISKTPIIILALGQAQAGQMDLVLHSSIGSGGLNNTRIEELIGIQSMPRISIPSISIDGIGGTAWFMDFQKQNRNKLGRFGYQIAQNEVFIHESYKFPIDKIVLVEWFSNSQLYYLIYEQIKNYARTQEQIFMLQQDLLKIQNSRYSVPFKIVGTFGVSMGKFKQGATPFFAYFNIKNVVKYIINYVSQNITLNNNTLMNSFITQLKISQTSERIIINIPDRNKIYQNPNYDQTALVLNEFGTNIINKVGIYAVDTEMPILYQISRMSYFGMFIGVILKLIIVSLFTLSVLMMYNTMMIGVEARNFDFGMLRTVGMSKVVLVGTVLVDSLKYVIIANIFAYPISLLCLRLASGIFQDFFGYNYRLYPTFDSIIVASIVGFLVPIVSSFVPIQVALGQKIVESINPIRNKTIGMKTQVYIQGREFPWSRFIFGFIACLFGVMIYYFLPQSLINQNIGMLLTIFFSLLIGLLVGLVLLSYSFHYLIQKLVAYITLFWVSRTNFSILLKNLSAHRIKNRRASLLYSLSISFIVFVSVGISIQIQSIYNQLLKSHGCYLQISGYINKSYYDQLLRSQRFIPYIKDFSYQTRSAYQYLQSNEGVVKIQVSDKARLFFNTHQIYGVSPNFLHTLYNQNFDIKDTLSKNGLDPVEFLYTKEGQQTTIISQYMSNRLNLNLQNSREYLLTISSKTSARRLRLNISSIFSKSAGLGFSSFEFLPSEIGVSLPTFAEICNIRNYDSIPYKRIIIKLHDPKKSTELANEIRREIYSKNGDNVWDYAELTQTITNIQTLLKKIFLILLLVVLLISFFSLLSTTSTNIINQTKQISILLGLGLQKRHITMIYIYQAFVLVFTACLIGIFVGGIVAYTMGLQRELFGDFDITIDLSGIWIIMLAAILSAIASTYGPIKRVLRQRVADIMKMV